jgi:hypothetical protein
MMALHSTAHLGLNKFIYVILLVYKLNNHKGHKAVFMNCHLAEIFAVAGTDFTCTCIDPIRMTEKSVLRG